MVNSALSGCSPSCLRRTCAHEQGTNMDTNWTFWSSAADNFGPLSIISQRTTCLEMLPRSNLQLDNSLGRGRNGPKLRRRKNGSGASQEGLLYYVSLGTSPSPPPISPLRSGCPTPLSLNLLHHSTLTPPKPCIKSVYLEPKCSSVKVHTITPWPVSCSCRWRHSCHTRSKYQKLTLAKIYDCLPDSKIRPCNFTHDWPFIVVHCLEWWVTRQTVYWTGTKRCLDFTF